MVTQRIQFYHASGLLLVSLLLGACATPALWDATNPREYIAMSRTGENAAHLAKSKLAYRIDDERNLFYVEKSRLQKSRDYAIRTIGTPVTVALDAATTIVIVGAAIYVLSHADGYFPEIPADSFDQTQANSLQSTIDTIRKEERLKSGSSASDSGINLPGVF